MFAHKMTAEEKRKLKAAVRLQCAYRCYLARRKAQDHYRGHYKKIYDVNLRRYVYENKKTHDVVDDTPEFFNEVEFPNPRDFAAPPDYNPGNEPTGQGYAVVISNSQFPLGKWAPSHSELDNDHDKIVNSITHDFVGRIRPENCMALKNPTTMEVKDAFKHMKKIARVDGFIFIYIATHIVTLIGAKDPENEGETAYFGFRNSIWGKTKEIAESCIGIVELTALINGIGCRRKTIALNYAHAAPPRKALFAAAKQVYPPADILSRMGERCSCPVIGACAVGFKVRDYLQTYPALDWADPGRRSLSAVDGSSRSAATQAAAGSQQVMPGGGLYALYYSALWERVTRDLNLPRDRPIFKTPRPPPPGPVWTQNEQTGFAIKVDLPNDAQQGAHWRRMIIWRARRLLAKPVNVVKRAARHRARVGQLAPREVSLTLQGHSLFGAALIGALRGGASSPERTEVRLHDLFAYIYKHMNDVLDAVSRGKKAIDAAQTTEADNSASETKANTYKKKKKKKDQGKGKGKDNGPAGKKGNQNGTVAGGEEDDEDDEVRMVSQTPCLFVPHGANAVAAALEHPVCYKCGPPCAPERPYVLQVLPTAVKIQWASPVFDGVPPCKYRVYMKNGTRNFRSWEQVPYPGDIVSTVLLIQHLPIGVPCQFTVAAWSSGGWGDPSDPTSFVTPGEDQAEVTQELRWHRVRQGGVLAVLDQMRRFASSRDEQLIGLRLLHGIGLCACGFKSSKFALLVAQRCFEVAQRFDYDPEVMSYVFNTLTWCLHGKSERKVRQLCSAQHLEQLVAQQVERFRHHAGVVNSLQGLRRGTMQKYVPRLPEYRHKVLFPKGAATEDSSDDDDETAQSHEEEEGKSDRKILGLTSLSIE